VFPAIEDLRNWADRLEEVQDRLAPYFERSEPRQRAMAYIRGLVGITERKNGWQLAEVAGEATPDGMQRLLNTAHWDADQVRDDLREYILTHLSDPEAVLVVDETGKVREGHEVSWRGSPIYGNGRQDRQLPDRRLSGLRQSVWSGAAGPGVISA